MKADGDRSATIRTFVGVTRVLLLLGILTILSRPGTVRADDCVALGGSLVAGECQIASAQTKAGVFNLDETLHILGTGRITVPLVAGGNSLTLNINGNFIVDTPTSASGGRIISEVGGTGQRIGANITVNAAGDIHLKGNGGATDVRVSSDQTTGDCGTGSRAGNITLTAMAITIEDGALVSANARCSAGAIELKADDILIAGTVESVSTLTGAGTVRRPGGGPITIDAACTLQISSSGEVRSQGRDPGADLVHLEGGCEVVIEGLVESTGPGHGVPNTPPNHCNNTNRPDKPNNSTACIEVWAGDSLIIDASGANNGEINADTAQSGGHQIAWIDLFANGPITIIGNTAGDFAVHANESVSNADGGIITIKSVENSITASGNAVRADAVASGSHGGSITIEANYEVTLDSASLEAKGDAVLAGGLGKGGMINVRSFNINPMTNKTLSWTSGVGNVLPTGDGVTETNQTKKGIISLQDCAPGAIDTTGTDFPKIGSANPPPPTIQADACGGAPTLPSYVTLPLCTCIRGISIDKVCSAVIDSTGTIVRVDFSGKVMNTGTVTLTDLQVTDTTQPTISGIIFDKVPASSLPQGQSADYAGHYFVTPQLGVLSFSDTVTATAKSQGATVTSPPATASCALTVEPKITVTKECKNSPVAFPNPVQFGGTVCNGGLEQLVSVTVTDSPIANPAIPPLGTLNPGQCANYNGSYVPTQVGLQQKDTVTAVGKGKLSDKTAIATASALCDVVGPDMEVTKSCSSAVSSDGKNILVTVNGTIKNTGGVPLTITKITDNPPATLTPTKTTIAPNETVNYAGSYTVSSIPVNGLSDTVTVEAKDANNTTVSKEASAQCSLDIVPSVTIDEQCSNPTTPLGSPLEFSGKVCNTGKEELKNLVISDDKGSTITPNTIATLAPPPQGGVSCISYTGKYTPSGSGPQTNNVQVVGQGTISGKPATGTSFATCTVAAPPAIEVTKSCASALSSGGNNILVTVNGTIKNTGGVALTITKITDNPPATLTPTKTTIAPNETVNYAGSYTVSSIPVNGLSDTVTVEAKDANNTTVSKEASAQCSLEIDPSVTIDEQCTNPNTPLGSPLEFSGKVCNTGQEELKNLVISDDKGSAITPPTIATLAPPPSGGQSCVTYTGKYTPTESGPQTNNVQVVGMGSVSGKTASGSSFATCTVLSQPAISITKDCSCVIDSSGTSASIQFTGKVCNDGNENLTNVKIYDDKPNADTLIKTITSLLPGEANCVTYSGSYPTTTLANSDTVTAIGVGSISGSEVIAQDGAACGCSASPDMTVTTACSPAVAPVGSPLSFTGKVCSTGNVALGNVTVVSDKPKTNTNITLPKTTLAALASGQTPGDAQCVTYSGQYKPNGSGAFSHTITAIGQSILGNLTEQAAAAATCVLGQSCFPADWVGLAAANSWIGYSPQQKVSAIFSVPSSFSAVARLTLVEGLGSQNVTGSLPKAAADLVKEALAGLLNAAHPQVNYPVENTATIVSQVNAALASNDLTTMKKLAATFRMYNELGGAAAFCQTTPPPC